MVLYQGGNPKMKRIIFKIIIISILGCFLAGFAGAESEFTVSGTVNDGISNQPIPEAKVYLSVQSSNIPFGKQNVEYATQTTTDAEGKYLFSIPIDTTMSKQNQTIRMLVAAKGYIGTIDYDIGLVKTNISNLTLTKTNVFYPNHNFWLLPEGKEATIKGTIRDAATLTPLSNIPIELSLFKSDRRTGIYILRDKEVRNLVTDIQGKYSAYIPGDYADRINSNNRWQLNIKSLDYNIAAVDPNGTGKYLSRDTTGTDSDQDINIAMVVTDYYLISKTATGKLEGTLLDTNNKPSAKTNLRIEILPAGAAMYRVKRGSQTDQDYRNIRIADFTKEVTTDKEGKFKCSIPLNHIYQSEYTLLITAAIEGNSVLQNFPKFCIPGESKRELEQKLDNGYTLKLAFETISRKER